MNNTEDSVIKSSGKKKDNSGTNLPFSQSSGIIKKDIKVRRSTDKRDNIIGQQIRTRRVILGISQQELSELLGISFQQLQKYEKGANRTTSTRLIDIAKHLRCSVTLFLTPAIDEEDLKDSPASLNDSEQSGYFNSENEDYISYNKNRPRNRELLELNRCYSLISSKITRRNILNLIRSIATQSEYSEKSTDNKESLNF